MTSAAECLGQLHSNYSDFSTSKGAPLSFEDCAIWNLIARRAMVWTPPTESASVCQTEFAT